MKKTKLFFLIGMLLSPLVFAGIYRHDADKSQYLALGKEHAFDCVGQVFNKGEAAGSCVLVGNKYVLSAAHVFIKAPQQTVNIADYQCLFNNQLYRGKKIMTYAAPKDSNERYAYDIVLIELQDAVKNISPAAISNIYDELHADVTGVGFGASGPANVPQNVMFRNEKIAGQNVVDSIGGKLLDGKRTILYCDFDCAGDIQCNKMGSPVPRPLEYICTGGDSGGGLFKNSGTNGWELVGICSGAGIEINQFEKTGYYGQIMRWTRVAVFAAWIKENIH